MITGPMTEAEIDMRKEVFFGGLVTGNLERAVDDFSGVLRGGVICSEYRAYLIRRLSEIAETIQALVAESRRGPE